MRQVAPEQWLEKGIFWKHIGIYAYRKDILEAITQLAPSHLEEAEKLEQLRWLENGYRIEVVPTSHTSIGIDTPDDIEKIKHLL
jgi:3-deoxy-manno-octulosonate cytidylyltransferase (CMP-KDO synthetase)